MMEDNNLEPSKSGFLCVLKDGNDNPLHMRIIKSGYEYSQAHYRDEAAAAILKQSPDVLSYTIEKYRFLDMNGIPDIHTNTFQDILQYIRTQDNTGQESISPYHTSEMLKPHIELLISKVPEDRINKKYAIPGNFARNIHYLAEFCTTNPAFATDVLKYNDYHSYQLIETSKGNWLFDSSHNGFGGLIDFYEFLKGNYFNPKFDIDRLTRSLVWIHQSDIKYPNAVNHFFPVVTTNGILSEVNIKSEDITVREESETCHYSPNPDDYWKNFIRGQGHNSVPDMSNNIATLLFFEQYGTAPVDSISLFFRSEFADHQKEFCNEIQKQLDTQEIPWNPDKLKAMATQIIQENGLEIRGRENASHQKEIEQEGQSDDFFYSRTHKSRRI